MEISHLKEEEQRDLLDVMEYLLVTPSLSQAQRMKKLSAENSLNRNVMKDMLEEEKRREHVKLSLPKEVIKKYFPEEYTPKQMEEKILGLLDQWQKKNRERKGAER